MFLLACGASHTNDDASTDGATGDAAVDVRDDAEDATVVPDALVDSSPTDTLRPRPDVWDPPFPVEPGGWRDSDEPPCSEYVGNLQGFDVWADTRGVFALVSVINNPFDPGDPSTPDGYSILFNSGDGWETWHAQESTVGSSPPVGMTGAIGGDLFTFGGSCQIERVAGPGDVSCSFLGDVTAGSVLDVSIVTPDFAWAVAVQRVLRFDGETWESNGAARPGALKIWGDAGQFSILTSESLFTFDGGLRERTDVPEGPYSTLWATARDDFWIAGLQNRILHYDGANWTEHSLGLSGRQAFVVDLWGDSDSLYFATLGAFGRIGDDVEVFATWDESEVTLRSIWGAPDGGVFIAVADERYDGHECGASFLVWFDGAVFRRF